MLTWEWTKNHALAARPAESPWAGRFWYSFYEGGASMEDFCQRALAYMTGRPLEDFAKKKTAELKDELLAQLHARPWLLILDGLERVLVAYHRIDAAEVPDEEANTPTDKIANRNPCDAIRDEDNDLLRALTAATPSKILVSSRLTPRVLLNSSGQAITGAKRITLPGLRPPDAEKLLRSCGVREDSTGGITGDSAAIHSYLSANCDNHPLVIGILGGLIANYLRDRGNFDAWMADPEAGAALGLGSLDLIQRRNHILRAALDALPDASRQLLFTLSLINEPVGYEILKQFNPHLGKWPERNAGRGVPGEMSDWEFRHSLYFIFHTVAAKREGSSKIGPTENSDAPLNDSNGATTWSNPAVDADLIEREQEAFLKSVNDPGFGKMLSTTVIDLEQRGLLQWACRERKHGLHPVVRGVIAEWIPCAERNRLGRHVVDHFSQNALDLCKIAKSMAELGNGIQLFHTLVKLGYNDVAADAYDCGLSVSLAIDLEAHAEALCLLRPLFPAGWLGPPQVTYGAHRLKRLAAIALSGCGELCTSLVVNGAVLLDSLEAEDWQTAVFSISNCSRNLVVKHRLAAALRVGNLSVEVATLSDDNARPLQNAETGGGR